MKNTMSSEQYYQLLSGDILQKASRSLAISIRIYPEAIRHFFCLLYLIGRALDTITDNTNMTIANRLQIIPKLSEDIKNNNATAINETVNSILEFFPKLDERELLTKISLLADWLNITPEPDKKNLIHIMDNFCIGDLIDLNTFNEPNKIIGFNTEEELINYCYYQIGSEMAICNQTFFYHLRNFSNGNEKQMSAYVVQYGISMQLINILRDMRADLEDGRCYLPLEQLKTVNLSPETILSQTDKLIPILNYWHEKILAGVDDGIKYILLIKHRRVKYACLIAFFVTVKSIINLKNISYLQSNKKAKTPRREVKKVILISFICTFSNKLARYYYAKLRKKAAAKVYLSEIK